ncbi:hypothetical protein HNY73_007084 [Argiope bruennichi]|uniref:Uncharacterized protein n=1 Tax=Argiope bruennichi TaxID=94029 RepID=A0A8T0FCW1_ARGBR|nr:hypothetical protein HNY73_007084 [Argiope bruennichi]
MGVVEYASVCTFMWIYYRVFFLNDWISCVYFVPFIMMLKTFLMDEFNKRHTGCQTAMDPEPVNDKMDTSTSIDETFLQPNEEAFDFFSNIDEAAALYQPESTGTIININPFFDLMTFDNPLAHLDATEQDEISICAEWILKHQAFFSN